jgi:formate-dependent phosphoribosylglycinamide formyltransferase (GAR transformylase)
MTSMKRLLLLTTSNSYRSRAFITVAGELGVEIVRGVNIPKPLAELYGIRLALDFSQPDEAVAEIVEAAQDEPFDAILAVDDTGTLLAARASAALGLPHNEPRAAEAARNKYRMRQLLSAGGIPCPWFRCFSGDEELATIAATLPYPVVVKPLLLSGSRGVIRANDSEEFLHAVERLKQLLRRMGGTGEGGSILVESYLPGGEVALEGLLLEGELRVLALFDKPDPLIGPYFEETIYVTPSRLPDGLQRAIAERTQEAAAALGLVTGPVHAELRYNEEGVWLIEIAGRSIGGLCGSILEFGTDVCLEEVIVRQAVGLPLPPLEREGGAAGVMMIPIPKRGILRAVSGLEAAEQVANITGIDITAPLDYPLLPLPEGESYLGFIFSRASTPDGVEAALREAHALLSFEIEDEIPIVL